MTPIIRVRGLSKRYRIGARRTRYGSLRDSICHCESSERSEGGEAISSPASQAGSLWCWSVAREKVRAQLALRNETGCLSENRSQGPCVQLRVGRHGQNLSMIAADSAKLHVTATLAHDLEAKGAKYLDDV